MSSRFLLDQIILALGSNITINYLKVVIFSKTFAFIIGYTYDFIG